MNTFSNIKELVSALNKEQKLLTEMFKKRKSASYKYEYARDLVDNDDNRIQYLLNRSVIRQNGSNLEIDDEFLQFFEIVLDANEEINTSYINDNLEKVKQNIDYYFNEPNEQRKYDYLRTIKNTLRKLGAITLRNVVDLKRNIDNTFKNEPTYKNKRAKLLNLDVKRKDITKLITQTEKLITEDDVTFFNTATDEELRRVIVQLKIQLGKCTHNLIEIERQIIDFLNQIQYQGNVIEKLRLIKYLKDQFTLETTTDLKSILAINDSVIFEPNPTYKLKLSLEYLQADEEVHASIKKIANRLKVGINLKRPVAEKISSEYLETQIEEEIQINLEEVKNGFVASSYNLFDFIINYNFAKKVSFEDRVTIYCQLISQYEDIFEITDQFEEKQEIEYAMVYPK
jgi:DNA uptake protein ComE-like DNA-binding protein